MKSSGCEFEEGHLESAITDNSYDEVIGAGELCPDGGWKTDAHRACSSSRQPAVRGVVLVELGGPHLVLAHVSGDDRLPPGQVVEFIDDLLHAQATLFPVAPLARFQQAQLLEGRGDLDKAFETYQMVITRYQASSLYSKARDHQAQVAHAAADGQISSSFLWFKPDIDTKKVVSMLETVRDNAPRSPSAAKAQYAIGKAYESKKWKADDAIAAYQKVVDNYPRSAHAPEAQYKIGHILMMGASKGSNQDNSNLNRALHTFEDLRQSYPSSKRAGEASAKIAEIRSRDIQRSFEIGEFYFKKGQTDAATIYFREVLRKTSGGSLHEKAQKRLKSINASG